MEEENKGVIVVDDVKPVPKPERHFEGIPGFKDEEPAPAPVQQQVVPEAPKEEPKKVKEKIKYNKFNKVLIYILIVVLVMTILLCLLQFTNPNFSKYMWINVNNNLSELLYDLMGIFPFVASYGSIIIIAIGLLTLAIDGITMIIYKNNLDKKSKVANILTPIIVICALLVNINVYSVMSNASHRGINEIYMKDHMYDVYTQDNLEELIDYFKNRIIIYSESLDRENGKIVINKDSYDLAVEDIKNLSAKYEFLKGNLPTKIHTLSDFDLERTGYPLGLTYNFTVGLDDINLSNLEKIFTLTHEFCHVKGIHRESDADYCAFLAGYNSNSDVSKYAMYIGLMPNLLNALKNIDLYNNIKDEFGIICIESGYSEICNLYEKDVNRFISGSNQLELYTYSLDVYKEYKEELKQYLVGLKNRFNVTIYDDEEKQISLEEANRLIDDESSTILYLVGSINESKFNENKKYLNTISDYFPHLFLSNSEEKEEDYSSFDYLKVNPVGNYISLTAEYPEFSYDRSVRSILEYFDKYIFN